MKKTVILSLIIAVYTIHVHAQSIYHSSIGNTVSPSFAIAKTSEDNLAKGTGVVFSLNSSVDFGLSYNWYNDETENIYDGKGFAGYINFLLTNELKDYPLGVELAFLYNHSKYEERYEGITNQAFGIGLNISKRIEETGVYSIPQVGFTFFPVSQNEYGTSTLIEVEKAMILSATWGLAIENQLFTLIFEPTYSYEFEKDINSVGLAFFIQI